MIEPIQLINIPKHETCVFLYEQPSATLIQSMCRYLSKDEQRRAERYAHSKQRDAFLFSRYCLRTVLARHLKRPLAELTFATTERGKPHLSNHPQVYFNVSHSGRYLAIAVSDRYRVGVDIEYLGEKHLTNELPISMLAMAEQHYCQNAADISNAFFTVWTAKEAWVKALGIGIDDAFTQFAVLPTSLSSHMTYEGAHPNYPNAHPLFHSFSDTERQLIGCCALDTSDSV